MNPEEAKKRLALALMGSGQAAPYDEAAMMAILQQSAGNGALANGELSRPQFSQPFMADRQAQLSSNIAAEQARIPGNGPAPARSGYDRMMEGAGMDPDMRTQGGPDTAMRNSNSRWTFDIPEEEAMYRSLSGSQQKAVLGLIEQGVPVQEAFDAVRTNMPPITHGR